MRRAGLASADPPRDADDPRPDAALCSAARVGLLFLDVAGVRGRRRLRVARAREQRRAIRVLLEASVDEGEERRDRRDDRAQRDADADLLRRALDADVHVGVAEVAVDFDGSVETDEAELFRVALQCEVELLGPEADLA